MNLTVLDSFNDFDSSDKFNDFDKSDNIKFLTILKILIDLTVVIANDTVIGLCACSQ